MTHATQETEVLLKNNTVSHRIYYGEKMMVPGQCTLTTFKELPTNAGKYRQSFHVSAHKKSMTFSATSSAEWDGEGRQSLCKC